MASTRTLPARGFTVRIWPGRYPTAEQAGNYGDMLAPFVSNRVTLKPALAFGGGMLGDQGQPVDPDYLGEEVLQKKELDQGPSYFQLQHMLNTRLVDALRYPLKTEDLVVMRLGGDAYPMAITRGFGGSALRPVSVHSASYNLSTPHEISPETAKLQGCIMYVDPAGGGKNGDETAYAVTGFLNGNVFLLACGGLPGGYSTDVMRKLAGIAKRWAVQRVIIEQNMGYGAFKEVWLPILRAEHNCAVDDDYVHGQKELRIIETLEPVMARGALIVSEAVIDEDHVAQEDRGPTFIWPDLASVAAWDRARYPATTADVRDLGDIALPELTAVLRACVDEDQVTEAARALGVRRLSAAGRDRLQQAEPKKGHLA